MINIATHHRCHIAIQPIDEDLLPYECKDCEVAEKAMLVPDLWQKHCKPTSQMRDEHSELQMGLKPSKLEGHIREVMGAKQPHPLKKEHNHLINGEPGSGPRCQARPSGLTNECSNALNNWTDNVMPSVAKTESHLHQTNRVVGLRFQRDNVRDKDNGSDARKSGCFFAFFCDEDLKLTRT